MQKHALAGLRQPSLRLTIIGIIFVVLLPTLGVVTATLYGASRSFQEAGTRQLLETARTVARSTISELDLTANVLQHLAQLQAVGEDVQLRRHMVSSFAHGELETHLLEKRNAQWQNMSDTALDATVQQLLVQAAQTGQLQVSDILMPADAEAGMKVVLAIPSSISPYVAQVATLTTSPEHLLNALARHGDGSVSVILAIVDGQGRILARSVDSQKFIGKPVPDWQTLVQQPGSSGSFTAQTLEGGQIIFAFQRVEGTPGWAAVVGESAHSFNQRSQRPIRVMLSAATIAICLALLLAMLLARKALQPIRSLAARAQSIAAGESKDAHGLAQVPPALVAEFEVLRRSLDQADQVLQRSLQESQRAESEAQTHLAVLQAAEEQARLGHWSLNGETGEITCSEMLSVLFGDPAKTVVIQLEDLRSRLQPESYMRLQAAVQQCLEDGTPFAMEVDHSRRDGSTYAAYLRGAAELDASGKVIAINGTLQDISEGKEQRERLAALADNLPSGVIFRFLRSHERRLLLQFLSAGLESLTGLSANAVLQHQGSLIRAIRPSHLRQLLRVLQGAQDAGHVLDEVFALRTQAGNEIWIHCRAALRYPGSGGAVWDGIARDVTAERAAEDALRSAKEAAEQAERAKSDFLATMSHEIRTPMNSVIGMARLAMRTELNPLQRNYLEKINEAANVLQGIINDILDFSKIEAGGLVLEGAPFKLEAVLDTVAAVTTLKAEEKGLEITYAMAPGLPVILRGDALRLGQVLTNLVSNAIKFTQTGGVVVRVEHRNEASGAMLHFSVTDSGIGLDQDQLRCLFQPFSQAQPDTSRRYGGTGLGLAISKRLVEMMGGSIGVHSEKGVGSTFYFSVRMDEVDTAQSHHHAPHGNALQGLRILIADDNSMARKALAEMAEGFGMQVSLVCNGQEALEKLHSHAVKQQAFDIVVLDWHMPLMDGVEAARHIRTDAQLEKMPAVLMVTAYRQEAMLEAAQGVDLQGILLKPVTQSAMYNTLLGASSENMQLEMQRESAMAGYAPSDLAAFADLHGKRVLVVDDNALNREVATDFLRHVGIQVITAAGGWDAIRCLDAQDVDAVLMDIHMPDMDGLAATREIRRHLRWKDLPIIALTAQARSEDVQRSREAGMDHHLTKPIDESALYSALQQLCTGTRAQDGGKLTEISTAKGVQMGSDVESGAYANLAKSPARRAQLLRGFLQDFETLPERFDEFLTSRQWSALAGLVHQIKGSATYLNAAALCDVADTIEVAARRCDAAVVSQHAGAFVKLMKACLDDVRDALEFWQAQQMQVSADAAILEPQAVLALIARARPLVAAGNFSAQHLLEELVQGTHLYPWAETAQAALDAFDDLENSLALQLLAQIEAQFNGLRRADT